MYLVTTDNDKDFFLNRKRKEEYSGKSQNRILNTNLTEYIEDFSEEMMSENVKRYENFNNLKRIFGK